MAVSRELTRLMENVRIKLPGALDDAIKLELFNVLNEFLTDSRCWLDEVQVDIEPEVVTYEVTPEEDGVVVSLESFTNSDDSPVAATMQIPGTVVLTNTPAEEDTCTAKVSLTVMNPDDTNGYPRMPDWLLSKHFNGILHGLLGAMMTQQAKPYTNERMAVYHIRKFRAAIANARAEARRQNLYGGQRWRFPQFAGSR
jgi:hypothetical protein